MATNTFAPTGLVYSRHFLGVAPAAIAWPYAIKKGYATAIGKGDIVQTGTSTNQGYITLATTGTQTNLGVFQSCDKYFDSTAQQIMHGLGGSWPTNANPAADVVGFVYSDPFFVYRIQYQGGPFAQSWVGQNVTYNSNGAPDATGMSTAYASGIATTNTFALKVLGVVGVNGGPADPTATNPWLEVMFNFGNTELAATTGI